jgi:CheY-like chemotaxis protein
MDIQLPDVSGLQVTQGGKHLRHIPVIAKKIGQGGCESYIAKPFSIETSSKLCAIISTNP